MLTVHQAAQESETVHAVAVNVDLIMLADKLGLLKSLLSEVEAALNCVDGVRTLIL